jgi:glycerol-3-phosphate dehydrogenase
MLKRHTAAVDGQRFDIVVIGGGITGAAVAYEAASRGLSVALFEKGDFARATSAASSKLIHGGLRYLSNLEYGLVRESLKERRILENIAPNLVYPLPMLFPHYRSSLKDNKWMVRLGLITYDLLAYDRTRTWDASKQLPPHRSLTADAALRLQPILRKEGLTGASIFHDCLSIFPERLALSFIQSAAARGAAVANYAEVCGFRLAEGGRRVCGVQVRDRLHTNRYGVDAEVVLNCTGPWVDHLLQLARPQTAQPSLLRSEGIHLITRPIINPQSAVSAVTPRGRHCFLIPWREHTLIGTTDTPYEGHPDDYRVTAREIALLLDEVNASFDDLDLTFADIRHAYGGLRPLVRDPGGETETYTASRRFEIRDGAADGLAGLITVEGGKWTTSRALAEKVVDHIRQNSRLAIGRSISAGQYLTHSAIRDMAAFEAQIAAVHPKPAPETIACLGRYYGAVYGDVLALAEADPGLGAPLNADGEILAQVVYAVRCEMAQTLLDIVLRRTGIATLGHPGPEVLEGVAAVAAAELGWDEARRQAELEAADAYLQVPALKGEVDANKS